MLPAGLWTCVSQDWTPQIGDPEATGWLTVLAYLVCNSTWTLAQAAVVTRWFPTPGTPAAARA